eukprot:491781-Rhodomonas_salina.3
MHEPRGCEPGTASNVLAPAREIVLSDIPESTRASDAETRQPQPDHTSRSASSSYSARPSPVATAPRLGGSPSW